MTSDDGHGVPQSFGGTSEGFFSGRRVHCQLDAFRRPMKAAATNQAFADPLVATTAAFVRADRRGIYHD
jgi:hypothetical protein